MSFPPVYEDDVPQAESSTSAARMASLRDAAHAYTRDGRNTDAFRPICEYLSDLLWSSLRSSPPGGGDPGELGRSTDELGLPSVVRPARVRSRA